MTDRVSQERFFAIVPVAVIYDPSLQHSDVRVYATLSERAGKKRHAWPGMRRIATDLGMSPTTVSEAVGRLERAGHVQIERQPGTSNDYWLPMRTVSDTGSVGVPDSDTPPDHAYQSLVQTVSDSGTELDEGTKAAAASFESFVVDRARVEARSRARQGYVVKSEQALAFHIAADEDFRVAARHVWNHRDCDDCEDGYRTEYAPGAGQVAIECTTERA